MSDVNRKKTAIAESGDCFDEYLQLVEEKMGKQAADQTRRTALDVVKNCVTSYINAFGSNDVGASGTGRVSVPKSTRRNTEPPNVTGLLYGKVQSGKTNTSMASVALSLENGFRCFVVLTSDNTLLGTLIADDFIEQLTQGPTVYRWSDWHADPKGFGRSLRDDDRLADTGVVFVTTKNTRHLKNLQTVLKEAGAKNFPAIILDDEADNASLDTNKAARARGNDVDPGATFSQIGELREELSNHIYLQVTATPQSLFLQTLDDPCRPRFCVLSTPGEGYVGGREFFANESKIQREVDPSEFDELRSGQVPVGKGPVAPRGLRDALAAFLLGCAQKKIEDTKLSRFSFLAHVDIKKVNHEQLRSVIDKYIRWLDQSLRGKLSKSAQNEAEAELLRAYADLNKTAKHLKPLDQLQTYVERMLRNLRAEIINSDTGGQEVRYRAGPNIFVGGNRLSRGVRIDNLMVTYYGRDAKTKLMDTVHQHARMFGYRKKLLDVTRVYSTRPILDSFKLIHEADEAMREMVEQYPSNLAIKPVWIGPKLRPTRANVLNPFELGVMVPGRAIYPWCPKFEADEIKPLTKELDTLLEDYEEGIYHEVPVNFIAELLKFMPSEERDGWIWNDERVQEILRQMQGPSLRITKARIHISSRNGRGFQINRKEGGPTDTAEGSQLNQAKQNYGTVPTLFLRKQEGSSKQRWDDCPFYAPTLLLPDGKFVFMFSNV
ncbi:Z1 domain-containing protein [Archangium violaceum]|uniref:Putative endonuclease Z1 domain-containing protein n=1 Tax=Archangium violaceum Cb vi76 TaxID=1406225 RepID=A0A084SWN8_9BACT|nr:Z1 domain-containing protein [Archangium violaceum]KFA92873.1 hypothetical protein Q664_12775 [Archangium violaceum Cb vi76]